MAIIRRQEYCFFPYSVQDQSIYKSYSFPQRDSVLNSDADLEGHIVDYFLNLYDTNNQCTNATLIDSSIPKIVTSEENASLTIVPTAEEIRATVFSMDPRSRTRGLFWVFLSILLGYNGAGCCQRGATVFLARNIGCKTRSVVLIGDRKGSKDRFQKEGVGPNNHSTDRPSLQYPELD